MSNFVNKENHDPVSADLLVNDIKEISTGEVQRIACHRCGNIRKQKKICSKDSCPHIYCQRCVDKMREEFGNDIFSEGCPVCKKKCCCSNKSSQCNRKNHCYRKCPVSKAVHKLATESLRESKCIKKGKCDDMTMKEQYKSNKRYRYNTSSIQFDEFCRDSLGTSNSRITNFISIQNQLEADQRQAAIFLSAQLSSHFLNGYAYNCNNPYNVAVPASPLLNISNPFLLSPPQYNPMSSLLGWSQIFPYQDDTCTLNMLSPQESQLYASFLLSNYRS